MISDDWDDCAKSDIGLRETESKAKISDRIMNSIVMLHTMTIIAYCAGTVLKNVKVTDSTAELPYVDKLDIPFNVNTQLVYRSILFVEFLVVIMSGWAAGVTNALLLSLTLHAAGQMDILRNWLTQLVSRANESKHESTVIMLKQIVEKHQKIINFSESIENLYTQIAFLQFASNMIMICSLGFVIVTAIGSPDATEHIVRSLLFYTITNLEAFIFCYAGEYLSNKSKLIGIAAYNTMWYDLAPRDGQVLLFVILRSQKQLTLTAGKMVDLSLESFANIMKASGSYLSVLLAMN
ncbi:PREDICTED: odorant receptor 4-like [Dinoponera quadriceps]|uniref:Odorant receptor 4-like n=1 Tax=Dinoponera quadriceps TaxID=609295 RepID=A0A6P3XP98_DINQU|nr:PREDICTED: odorant receptor 4-like [Dinoponera quadriceps]